MTFLLSPDETLPDGLRRIVREQLDVGVDALHPEADDFDAGVHEARKSLKRIRAVLRLIRAEIGGRAFKTENRCFREAGRSLAPARDVFVLRSTLAELARSAPGARTAEHLTALAGLKALGPSAASLWSGGEIHELRAVLAGARARVADWPLERDSFDAIRDGLLRTHRQGTERMHRAFESETEAAHHSWRRRAKELWYQVQILSSIAPARLEPLVKDLDALGDALGLEHDLALARDVVTRDAGEIIAQPARDSLVSIDRAVDELRNRARAQGLKVFSEESGEFVARIEDYWRRERSPAGGGDAGHEQDLMEARP